MQAEKGGFKHFMLKEIHEQPRAVADTLAGRLDLRARRRHPRRHRPRRRPTSSAWCSSPAAPRITPRWSASSSSRASRGCRSRSTWRPSSATATRSSARATWWSPSASRARPPTPWRRSARPSDKGAKVLAISNVLDSSIPRLADYAVLHPRRPRDRRGLDQGVHHPAGARWCWSRSTWAARAARCRAERARELLAELVQLPTKMAEVVDMRRAAPGHRPPLRQRARVSVPGPRQPVPHRARGRAQAQGDLATSTPRATPPAR